MGMALACMALVFWAGGGQGRAYTRNREEITYIRGPRRKCPGCSRAGGEGLPEWGLWGSVGCRVLAASGSPGPQLGTD